MLRVEYGCALKGIEGDFESIKAKVNDALSHLNSLREKGDVGFMDLPYQDPTPVVELARKKREIADTLVLIGIGGSSLGAECLVWALGREEGFYVLDNVDPVKVLSVLDKIDCRRTCFNVVSKSGTTTETIVNFTVVLDHLRKRLSQEEIRDRLVITTDPQKGFLREYATANNIESLTVPPNVGGRYSVLSPVGLFPAAFQGIDVNSLLKGARAVLESEDGLYAAQLIAAVHYLHYLKGKNVAVMMPYAERLSLFVDWWRQLWAESLGKEGKGQTPAKAMGTVDQHSQIQLYNDGPKDKLITFMIVEDMGVDVVLEAPPGDEFSYLKGKSLSEVLHASYVGTSSALVKNGVPVITIRISRLDEVHMGALFMLYELATALMGILLGINPFDQPGVEEGKRLTHGLLGRRGYEKKGIEAREIEGACSKSLLSIEL